MDFVQQIIIVQPTSEASLSRLASSDYRAMKVNVEFVEQVC